MVDRCEISISQMTIDLHFDRTWL